MNGTDIEKFWLELINKEMQKIEMAFVAKIIKFDKAIMRATIRPLMKAVTYENGENDPTETETIDIENVPVEMIYAGDAFIRPDYQLNDLVKVSMYASSIQQPIDSDIRVDMLQNRFQFNYCTVTSGVKPKDFTFPTSFASEDGLIIGNSDTYIIMKSDKIQIEGDLDVQGNLNVSGKIDAGGDVVSGVSPASVSLFFHTHPASGAPPTPT